MSCIYCFVVASSMVLITVIKVVGRINLFYGQRSINAFNFEVIDVGKGEMGQYMHFMLEVIYAHLTNTAAKKDIDKMNQENRSSQSLFDQQRKARWQEIESQKNGNNSSNSNSNDRGSSNRNVNGWNNNRNNNNHNHNNRNSNNNNGYQQSRNNINYNNRRNDNNHNQNGNGFRNRNVNNYGNRNNSVW